MTRATPGSPRRARRCWVPPTSGFTCCPRAASTILRAAARPCRRGNPTASTWGAQMNRFRTVLSAAVAALLVLVLANTALEAQTGTIRGTVTDSATQGALQGALVTVVGGTARAETNQGGQYALPGIDTGAVRVRVQLIGYAPAEREVTVAAGDATADFVLVPGVAKLEEIVSVGYGTQTRAELSTSVSSVGAAELVGQ